MIVEGNPPAGTRFFPTINFGLFASTAKEGSSENFFNGYEHSNVLKITAQPNVDAISRMQLESQSSGQTVFKSGSMEVGDYSKSFFKVAHYAIQVQKQRLRFWVNDQKVFDVPKAVDAAVLFNQLYFDINAYGFYNERNFGLYLSNIKIATGLPDTRHKLLDEGKFSTTGILFDVSSDVIKPQSYGVLKEIGELLKANPSVKVKIIGHTDSDGDERANLELSKRRAAAVKAYLVKEYGIADESLQSDGKGEGVPVADNKTKEGKALNRRVEFVKL